MMSRVFVVLAGLVAIAGSRPAVAMHDLTESELADGWHALFNGTDLTGWTTSGNIDAWDVEDGAIVCRPGGGNWLRTVDQYRDFELLAEFKVSEGANSGIGLRASSTGDPAFTGFELQVYDSHGQDPAINGCGAIYNAIAPTVQAVRPAGEWNTCRVKVVGDTLNVWLNDEHIHVDQKLDDRGIRHRPEDKVPLRARVKSGYICLQDHGDPVAYRNLKIKPIRVHPLDRIPADSEPAWRDLFNGRDLDGWDVKGNATWAVENGMIVGRDGGPGHLYSTEKFRDFEVRAKVMINTRGNSGFYFRANPPEGNPNSWPAGYEAQVDHNDPKNFTGCLYDRAWSHGLVTKENEWFDYAVRAVGDQITVAINGKTTLTTMQDAFESGSIAFQGHHPGSVVRVRDVQIRSLDNHPKRHAGPVSDGIIDVFYCTHSAGFRHPVLPESREIMTKLGDDLEWLRVTVSNDIADLTPERLKRTDVVMFYTTGMLPMDDEQKAAFMDFCLRGGGFVGVHSATDTYAKWQPYVRHIGGTFVRHPWHENVGIIVEDTNHPSTRHFGGSRFEITDEIYTFVNLSDDRKVLMRLDNATTKNAEPDAVYPIAWTRFTGHGRVWYSALGHRPEVWRDQRFVDHVLGGIRWAAHMAE